MIATATDQAGNISEESVELTVTIDTTAPATPTALGLTAESDSGASSSDGITQNTSPTITVDVETGTTANLFLDGELIETVMPLVPLRLLIGDAHEDEELAPRVAGASAHGDP